MAQSNSIVELTNVTKDYKLGNVLVPAVRGVDLTITTGELVALMGPSGSGKTTVLNLVGCVDVPTGGEVTVAGQRTNTLSERALTSLRLRKIGFVFQSFNLIGVLTALQNVEFPLILQGVGGKERRERSEALLGKVGLREYLHHRPNQLSGGQRQRVAVARALVTNPAIVLADEPTANLDSTTGRQLLDLMKQMNQTEGTTFVFSTHDNAVMQYASRVVRLSDGRISA